MLVLLIPPDYTLRIYTERIRYRVGNKIASFPQPGAVQVSRPSDVLIARSAARSTFSALVLGLGAVALLIGAVGVANVMVISVLERARGDLPAPGAGRYLAAGRRAVHGRGAVALSGLGGAAGVVLGAAATSGDAAYSKLPVALPAAGIAMGIAVAVAAGMTAGLYPALRAARLDPADALRSA